MRLRKSHFTSRTDPSTSYISYITLAEKLNQVKYVPINTIYFDLSILGLFPDNLPQLRDSTIRSKYIVELVLWCCEFDSSWFNLILNNLPNLAYLSLTHNEIEIMPDTPSLAPKRLMELRVLFDEWLDGAAVHFLYSDLSPASLDLTGTITDGTSTGTLTYGRDVRRLYESWLSLIEKHSETLKESTLDKTEIEDDDLIELATKENLRDLRISARHCRGLTRKSRNFIRSSRLGHRISI